MQQRAAVVVVARVATLSISNGTAAMVVNGVS